MVKEKICLVTKPLPKNVRIYFFLEVFQKLTMLGHLGSIKASLILNPSFIFSSQ